MHALISSRSLRVRFPAPLADLDISMELESRSLMRNGPRGYEPAGCDIPNEEVCLDVCGLESITLASFSRSMGVAIEVIGVFSSRGGAKRGKGGSMVQRSVCVAYVLYVVRGCRRRSRKSCTAPRSLGLFVVKTLFVGGACLGLRGRRYRCRRPPCMSALCCHAGYLSYSICSVCKDVTWQQRL